MGLWDVDADGVPDDGLDLDRCPDTPSNTDVDASGCSQAQFCEAQTDQGSRICLRSDWQNNEPIMRASNRDCDWDDIDQMCVEKLIDPPE